MWGASGWHWLLPLAAILLMLSSWLLAYIEQIIRFFQPNPYSGAVEFGDKIRVEYTRADAENPEYLRYIYNIFN